MAIDAPWVQTSPPTLDDTLARLKLGPDDEMHLEPMEDDQSLLVLVVRSIRLAEACERAGLVRREPRLRGRPLQALDYLEFVCPVVVTH
ncbi:MAG: hypothetical protein KTR31_37565 [Myxococcales bacterium]|nr:hypothetical protein [Myxococcales bacterium]